MGLTRWRWPYVLVLPAFTRTQVGPLKEERQVGRPSLQPVGWRCRWFIVWLRPGLAAR